MLKRINELKPFFEDCYRELGVREYAREIKVTPPTASKMLKEFAKQDLLKQREERGFLLFRANRESSILKKLSHIYWEEKLKELVQHISEELHPDAIVLFGSLSKLEVHQKSDIDLAVFTKFEKKMNLEKFEKKLDKEIQLFVFESLEKVNKELRANILRGDIMEGGF
jgi:predicted nucleotidyltransferase